MYKLLIIEDEEEILDTFKDVFEHDGNITYTASNGLEGLKLALEHTPDLILCDITMPVLDGFQLKKKLKENKKTQDIPFIFLTAKTDIKIMREGMKLGADDYIVKPVSNKELQKIVYDRLQRIQELSTKISNKNELTKLTPESRIIINYGKASKLVSLNEILFIDVVEHYSNLNLIDGKKTVQKKSLKSWEEILPPETFLRVHHNTIVNLNHIDRIEPYFNGALVLKMKYSGNTIMCSKRYSQKIKSIFKK
ncbi:MAG: LytTR family DNA-binding domain-containing protein [Ignavibacteriales bacterium]|nr:LytTR family DNA-binding domain-containing protein [Ignavibacteriales bacterium]